MSGNTPFMELKPTHFSTPLREEGRNKLLT
jgi:hypothetical protein